MTLRFTREEWERAEHYRLPSGRALGNSVRIPPMRVRRRRRSNRLFNWCVGLLAAMELGLILLAIFAATHHPLP